MRKTASHLNLFDIIWLVDKLRGMVPYVHKGG